MKVVHIISGLGIGGAELMLARLISGATEDTQHYVISLTDVGPLGNELRSKGVSVHALGVKYTLGIVFALVSLVRLIRQIRPDIVQTWMYHADLVGGLAARAAGVTRIIWGVRTTDISVGAARSTIVTRWICARLSAIIPTCIVCAAEASRIAHARLGYADSRMVVIPNGFDVEKLSVPATASAKFRASNDLPADALLVGCVGRFHPVKDHRNFVLAAAQIASEYQKALFVMIGRDLDWANTELVGWIGGTGFKDRFRLLGQRDDIANCLAALDVFCLSSRTEGFPNTVGEAMAVALPCVVTDVGDAGLLVGESGVVVPKESPAALSAGVAKILAMPKAVRQEIGKSARTRILSEFTLSRTRQRFNDLYISLLQNAGS